MLSRDLKKKGEPFLPTSTDIKNEELINLANQLKKDSYKETLSNILEWQERNIQFWWERWPFKFCLLFFIPIIIFAFVSLFMSMSLRAPMIGIMILLYTLLYAVFLIIITLIPHRRSLSEKKFTISEVLFDTFRSSLSVDKILKYKLAVCRDYTKLTASLLFILYPDSELYFIKIFQHIAVGIKIENQIYVLDQRLPILKKDNWLSIRNKKATIYCSKLIRDSGGIDVILIKCETIPKKSILIPKINTGKLAEEISKMLEIKGSSNKDKTVLNIELFDYAEYYDNDEIIEYSFMRAIKNRLESEFCGNLDKISKVNINQNDEKDLIVTVFA